MLDDSADKVDGSPMLVASDSTVVVAWSRAAGGSDYDLWYRKSTGGGFGISTQVIDNAGASLNPSAAYDGAMMYAVWNYAESVINLDSYDIYYWAITP